MTTPQDATEAPQTFTRLQEAIEGGRRFWHSVEVRPDDLALLLDFVASRAAISADGWSVVRTEDVERLRRVEAAARDIMDRGFVVVDGETLDESCFYCDAMSGHKTWCWYTSLRAALGDPS